MKKIVALVLALVLVLTAVSALAAPSPQKPKKKTTGVTEKAGEIELQDVQDTDGTKAIKEQIKKDADAGNALASVTVELPEGFTKVSEMATVKFPAGAKNLKFKKMFQTPYAAGTTVEVLFGIPGNPVEWLMVTGVANAAGEVVFTLSEAVYNKIVGKEVVMIPVTKA